MDKIKENCCISILYRQKYGLGRQVHNFSPFCFLNKKKVKIYRKFAKQINRKCTKTTKEFSQIVLQKFEENPNTFLRIISSN